MVRHEHPKAEAMSRHRDDYSVGRDWQNRVRHALKHFGARAPARSATMPPISAATSISRKYAANRPRHGRPHTLGCGHKLAVPGPELGSHTSEPSRRLIIWPEREYVI